MASRVLGTLGGRAAARPSPAIPVKAFRAAFTTAVNNGDPAPATGSEEDRERKEEAGDGPVSRAAEKVGGVGRKVRDAAEEVKDAGRDVKDRAMEVGEDVKETMKEAR